MAVVNWCKSVQRCLMLDRLLFGEIKLLLDFSRMQRNYVIRLLLTVHLLYKKLGSKGQIPANPWTASLSALSWWRMVSGGLVVNIERLYYDICWRSYWCARKKQSGWFIDTTDVRARAHQKYLDDKARAHQKYLQSLCSTTKKAFQLYQRLVKKAVDKAKEAQINKTIGDVEHSEDGKLRWYCI